MESVSYPCYTCVHYVHLYDREDIHTLHTLGRYPQLLRSDRCDDFRTAFDWLTDELRVINEF